MRLSRQCDVCELHFVSYVSQLNARFELIILPIWYFVWVCNFVSQLAGGIRFVRCISQLNTRCCLLLYSLFGWEFGLSTWKQNTLWEQGVKEKIWTYMRNFIIRTPHQIVLAWSYQGEWDERGMWHAWEIRQINIGLYVVSGLSQIQWRGADWINLIRKWEILRAPQIGENFLTSIRTFSFSWRTPLFEVT